LSKGWSQFDRFHRGDDVFGATDASFVDGYGEYAVASVKMITLKPSKLSYRAASVPIVAAIAWQTLGRKGYQSETLG